MSSLTELELQEIATFTKAAPTLFTGLVMDETSRGKANAQSIASYLDGRSQQYTVANLTAAVIALQHTLCWTAGNEPGAVPSDNRTRAQKAADGGIRPYEPTHYNDAANGIESSWAKNIRLGKEAQAQKDAAKEKVNRRFKETNQVVQNKVNGGIDYAASNELNEQARRRHAAEDAQGARAAGKPIPVAATTKVRVIPAGTTDFTGYSAEELKAYLARGKGRAGEPHGSLLR
jgi:hypothetical protein